MNVVERIRFLRQNYSSILVDIHSHNPEGRENILRLINLRVGKSEHLSSIKADLFYSVGIHPWDLKNEAELKPKLDQLEKLVRRKEVVAIGESGIDRSITLDMLCQKLAFSAHIELSREYKKPLILHTVRSHSDVLEILKKEKFGATKLPLILHDFRGGMETVKQYANYEVYFSYGHSLWRDEGEQKIFAQLPLEKIFLETDDQGLHSLEDIYVLAAEIKNISVEEMAQAMLKNLERVFCTR